MAKMHLVLAMAIAFCTLAVLTVATTGNPPAGSEAPEAKERPKRMPKINRTRVELFIMQGNIEWNVTRDGDDRRPSYALLHANVNCRSNYTQARDFISSLLTKEHWPNVHWKNGQDAKPTLYIFTKDKKYTHRHDVEHSTVDEIKELLRGHGFYGTPLPKEELEEDDAESGQPEAEAKKTEL